MTVPIVGVDYGGASAALVHQDRLVLAGSGVVPDILIASRTGRWLDFRLGVWQWAVIDGVAFPSGTEAPAGQLRAQERRADARDPTQRPPGVPPGRIGDVHVASFNATPADGFFVAQASGRGNRFHALLQQEGMFVLGDTGESVVPAGPFSGETVEVRENSWFGSDIGRQAVIAGGLVIFVQSGGEDIRGIAWTEAQRKYLAASMLTYAGDVFGRAVDMTFQRSTGRHGDTVYVVGEDGELGVMLLSVGAPHPAWGRWTLNEPRTESGAPPVPRGKVVGGAAPLGTAAWLVERDGVIALETPVEDAPCADGGPFDLDADPPVPPLVPGSLWSKENDRWLKWVPPKPDTPTDEVQLQPRAGWSGYPWEAVAETLPWIAQKRTGLQRSVRKVRCLDISLDLIVPRGYTLSPAPGASERSIARAAALLSDMRQAGCEIVSEKGTQRRRQKTFSAKQTSDTDRIARMRFGNSQGWRDRVGLRIRLGVRVSCAGLSFRMVA